MPIETSVTSTSTSPYSAQTFSAEANDKNTLTIQSYFKLLAAELANQDMTDPMDTGDIMNQMSQMAMVQSLATVTTTMKTSMALNQQSYAASMIGREVTVTALDERTGEMVAKTGIVGSISLQGEAPTVYLQGDTTGYAIGDIAGVGAFQNGSGAAAGNAEALSADEINRIRLALGETTGTKKADEKKTEEDQNKVNENATGEALGNEAGETKGV